VPVDNQWHHAAVTVTRAGGGVVQFYLDGVPAGAVGAGIPPGSLSSAASLLVGAGTFPGPTFFFRGGIDEVEIFRRTLAAAEVNGLWAAGPAGKCKVRCRSPAAVSFPPGSNCVPVQARICNQTAVPVSVNWAASSSLPISPSSGSVVVPPFSCRPDGTQN
jgi:hypothetical protein